MIPRLALTTLLLVLAAHATAGEKLPVRASSEHGATYLAAYAIDGNPKTRWASAISNQPQWIEIDFGAEQAMDGLVIHWETAHAIEYKVQVSPDGKTWETLHHETKGRGGKEVVTTVDGRGRYLRILCIRHGSWKLSSIYEIEPLSM